ncbi:MAG: tetratricopeptide repeat protein [Myxococcota bacterium]
MSAGLTAALSLARPPVPAPVGEVCVVLARVVAPAELWEHDPDGTGAGLRMVSALLKRLLVSHDGYEIRMDGGELLAAFSKPGSAAKWALEVQKSLLEADWPDSLLQCEAAAVEVDEQDRPVFRGLRMAMVLDVGDVQTAQDLRSRRTEYAGPVIDGLKSLSAAIHGGQVALTERAWNAVEQEDGPPLDADVTDLGSHRFPGREEPQALFQILPYDLESRRFPSLRSSLNRRTNLPASPGLFVGRERLLTAVNRFFHKGRRVVVLKGHGGIGKTRLATRYGGMHLHEYGDNGGVWFCDLHGARTIDGVCHAVAQALGVSLRSRSLKATQQLASVLASRGRCLLILDNFEQVTQHSEFTVALWARKAPRLRMLVTSRHRLGIRDEAMVEVTPLDSDQAVALFHQRATERQPTLDIKEDDPRLFEIADRVQCVPLAVELAAAWISVLGIDAILTRLSKGHRALEGVNLSVNERHTTLRAVMAGSWELLTPYEQDAFVSCSVFAGGFTHAAAAAIIDHRRFRGSPDVMETLRLLSDKSLVFAPRDEASNGLRLDQYDAIREFAVEKLGQMGLRPTLEQRHARYYLAFAKKQLKRLRGTDAVDALNVLRLERGNLEAVYRRHRGRDALIPVQAALALDPLLAAHGPYDLHLEVLNGALQSSLNTRGEAQVPIRMARVEALLARARLQDALDAVEAAQGKLGPHPAPDVTAWIAAVRGWALSRMGEASTAQVYLEQAATLFENRTSHPHAPIAALRLGLVLVQAGELELAETKLNAVRDDAEARQDPWLLADALSALGDLARHRGQHTAGLEYYKRALQGAEDLSDLPRQSRLLTLLGGLHLDERRNGLAETSFQRARPLAEEIGDTIELAVIDGNLGRMRHHQGQGREAEALYRLALSRFDEVGATRWSGIFRGVMAALLHEQGRTDEAKQAYTEAHQQLVSCGSRRFAGLVLGRMGALVADEGDVAKAEALFTSAEEALQDAHDPLGLAAVRVHRGHVDLARARAGDSKARAAAKQRFVVATTPGEDESVSTLPPAAVSNDVRLALRLLRRSMELGARKAG